MIGTALLAVAIVLQLTALRFAPLVVVQPLGAIALVVTAVLSSRITEVPVSRAVKAAIALCVGGIGIFVTVAAFVATDAPISSPPSRRRSSIASCSPGSMAHCRMPPRAACSGRRRSVSRADGLHDRVARPRDRRPHRHRPLVAVDIGITVVGETAQAPWWAFIAFDLVGAAAVFGVFQLARHHPRLSQDPTAP